ncbi:MAG TPA: penicillin-binding transpeptidase domain-containing protein [Planctomycetota bacterium]|nr:penicillin-binding transpeptidase domain-containing protein [Planctomycetota bacterium]
MSRDLVFSRRMQWAMGLLLAVLALCFARLAWLQLWNFQKYDQLAQNTLTNEELVPAPRGRILDASGEKVLAEDQPSFDISVRVKELKLQEVVLKDVEGYHDLRRKAAGPYLRAVRDREKMAEGIEEQLALKATATGEAEEELDREITQRRAAMARLDSEIGRLAPEYRSAEEEFRRQRDGAIARLTARETMIADLAAISGVQRDVLARGLMSALEHTAKRYEGAPPPIATNVERQCWDRLYIRQHSRLASGREPFPGVLLTNGVRRVYPQGTTACHAVGYVKPMTELLYEGLAAGPEGRRSKEEADALAKRLRAQGLAPPEPEGLAFLHPFGKTAEGHFFFRTSDGERTWLRPRGSQRVGRALPDERVGAYGVEQSHNQDLRGQHAYRIWMRDLEDGLPVRKFDPDVPAVLPKPGADIKLTIDLAVQQMAEKALAESGRNGAAVFLDPSSGAILALASHPPFDPNAFVLRRNEEITRLFEDKRKPMLCRVYQAVYPPGSTYKPIVSSGALQEGVLTARSTFPCTGVLHLGAAKFECLGTHGNIEFDMAMRKSCNLFFYHTGMRSGGDRMARWSKNLGYGELSGVDLPGERAGTVPSPEWKRRKFQGQRGMMGWTDGDSCNMAIGQGALEVSPLQAAVAFAAIGNGGKVVRPHLVAYPGEEARRDHLRRDLKFASPANDVLKRALSGVVNESGTGRLCRMQTVEVAGKTGSAEHGKNKPTHAWFCGYAPANDPTVAFAVVLESGGHGGSAAAPVARRVLGVIFDEKLPGDSPSGEELD